MTYEDRIRQERPGMSKSFAKLADFLLDSYIEAAFMTASELAHRLDLDAATVVRFAQTLDYKGFPDMQREIRQRVLNDLLVRPEQAKEAESVPGVVGNAMEELSLALEQTRISLDTDALADLVDQIGAARRIVVLAENPAQAAAYNLVHFLEQGGFPIYIARSGVEDLARTVHTATSQDLLIALEVSGQSPYIAGALEAANKKGLPTAAVLGAASLNSARAADVVLAARSNPSLGVGIITIESIIFAVCQALRWRFAERFAGAEQAIAGLSANIQHAND
ncbi:MAG: MurR/RpiR family transcriptional regulator [Chloroflexota bacterium]|nr:MAG: MurR/RpiR family transcriptional regulator [Chloroflexota bacterium]UCF27897.1 MAG: MurR/RpiR family transcriptional regulator [Chloroflexota bacterium]